MGKTKRKKKLEKRKNYNPKGGKLSPPDGRLVGFEQAIHGQYPRESDWICGQMYLLIEGRDAYYCDNWRWCLVGDVEAEKKYQSQSLSGCCGFADKKVTHPKSGNVYQIGFNYGH